VKALVALVFVLVTSWCGVAAAAPIKIWHAYRGEEERALLESLAEAPQKDVVVLAIPYDAFSAKLASAIPFGEGPDLFVDSHERIGEYARRGFVAPVGDALEQGAYVEVALTAVSHDGELFAVPLSLKSLALYVNDDLVDTVPPDLEGIVELVPTLPAGVYAFAYEAQNTYAHAPILHAFGGRMLDDRDGFGFVGPEAERSLTFVADLLDAGAVPRDADGALVTNLFRAGKAAFAMSGPWLAADLGDSIRYHVEPLPRLRATGQPLRPMLTVESIMFSPGGAARPEVRALARHLAGASAAELRMRLGRAVSARRDVDASGDPVMRAFAEQAATAVPMPSSPAMRSTWEPAHKALRKVLRGEADPSTALAEAQRRFDEIRRPPPPPASPTPALVLVGIALLFGAWALVRRVRTPAFRKSVRRSLPAWAPSRRAGSPIRRSGPSWRW